MAKAVRVVAKETLHKIVSHSFSAAGCSHAHSKIVADVLPWADLRGVDSHGVVRVLRDIALFESREAKADAPDRRAEASDGPRDGPQLRRAFAAVRGAIGAYRTSGERGAWSASALVAAIPAAAPANGAGGRAFPFRPKYGKHWLRRRRQ